MTEDEGQSLRPGLVEAQETRTTRAQSLANSHLQQHTASVTLLVLCQIFKSKCKGGEG